MLRDYRAWHDEYDDPDSSLAERLRVVRARLDELLSAAPSGPVRILSLCAGQGRDVVGVLAGHWRRVDATAVLIELDPINARAARHAAAEAGLDGVEVVEGDAGLSDVYAPFVPADIVVACGIFGNVSNEDVEVTVRNLSMVCGPGAAVIWTRHRSPPDLTPRIRQWLTESGFTELSFDALDNATRSAVGTARLIKAPAPYRGAFRFFTFLR